MLRSDNVIFITAGLALAGYATGFAVGYLVFHQLLGWI